MKVGGNSVALGKLVRVTYFFPLAFRRVLLRAGFRVGALMAATTPGIVHGESLYSKLIRGESFLLLASSSSTKYSIRGIYTGRFPEICVDETGVKICKCDKEGLWEISRRFLDDFMRESNVYKKVDLVWRFLRDLVNSGYVRVGVDGGKYFVSTLLEELIHLEIVHNTTIHALLNAISWEERVLYMYILEKVHRVLGSEFPRTPEHNWKSGLRDEEVKKVLERSREILIGRSEDLRGIIEAFKEIYYRLCFKYYYYLIVMLPFVEIPTWIILREVGLISREDFNGKFESQIPGGLWRIASEVEDLITSALNEKKLSVNDIVTTIKKSLSLPIEDVKECLFKEKPGVEVECLTKKIFSRFKSLIENRSVKVYEVRGGVSSWLRLFRIFKMKDIAEVFSDILSEEPEVLECVASLSTKPTKPGIVLSSSECSIIYDKWTMEESSKICGGIIVKRTGKELATLEDLVGSTPLVLRGYLMLRHYLKNNRTSEVNFIRERVGVDESTWSSYVNYITNNLSYVDILDRDSLNMSSSHVVDSILGVIYTFAKLGEKATRLGGLHGIYIYSTSS